MDDSKNTQDTAATRMPRRRVFQLAGALGAGAALPIAASTAATAATAATTTAAGPGTHPADPPLVTASVPSLLGNFLGTCQAGGAAIAQLPGLAGMRWDRLDFGWNSLEPTPGEFSAANLAKLEDTVRTAQAAGVTVLPILDYTAFWAVNREAYAFDHGGRRYRYGPVTGEETSFLVRRLTVTGADGAVVSDDDVKVNKNFVPPADPAAWLSYVERVVAHFSQPPFNLEYFQVWNEAHPGSGFWLGGMDEYVTDIHLPAAAAIRRAGCKVVYGGWPCGVGLDEMVALLDKHRAWDTLDVLDVHYDPLAAMDFLRRAARSRRAKGLPVWQTEHGFVTDGTLVPNLITKTFHWALREGLATEPDLVKMFWFAWSSPDDPKAYGYHCSLHNGTAPSDHGRTLAVLGDLLGGNRVTTYSRFETDWNLEPRLDERASGASGFRVGDGIVIAFHLARQGQANIMWDFGGRGTAIHLGQFDNELVVRLPEVEASARIARVDLFGNRTAVPVDAAGRGVEVRIPVQEVDPDVAALVKDAEVRTFYLAVDR